ncbi:MAG: nickel pincer cofactor biosynthesis protein LarB [Myxococcales bacterium]|nr:nickel pincer cofactor biosynthesis protein LarB [Myxococcales bacterium]
MSTSEITLDFQRTERIGFEEAIFSQGKTVEQLNEILDRAKAKGASLLLTRLSQLQLEGLTSSHRAGIDYEPVSRTGFFGTLRPAKPSRVAIVAAGTSDVHVFREIARTARYYGHETTGFYDVGVAGIWRLMERVEAIKQHAVVIVVAGMDAALPTVVGGLVGSVVIAVPTSNGYGVAEGGHSALNAMLASCAPGVPVMNIDNGYGAACAALRVLNALDRAK